MKHTKRKASKTLREQGTPFCDFNADGITGAPTLRVMPSGFSYPVLPAACTFILSVTGDPAGLVRVVR